MFSPCRVITITTDFGHQGPFVATMKGRILSRAAGCSHHRRDARSTGLLACRGRLLAVAVIRILPGRNRASGRRRSGCRDQPGHHCRCRRRTCVPGARQWFAGAGCGSLKDLSDPPSGCGSCPQAFWSRNCRAPLSMVAIFLPRLALRLLRATLASASWVRPIRDIVPSWVDEPAVTAAPGGRRHHHDRSLRQPDHQYRCEPDRGLRPTGRPNRRPQLPAAAVPTGTFVQGSIWP